MAKYRAKQDIPPNVKAGDIVEANEELTPEFKALLEPFNGEEAASEYDDSDDDGSDSDDTIIANPNREDLKNKATELGFTFAANIPTAKLVEIIEEAERANNSGDNGDSDGDDGDEDESED